MAESNFTQYLNDLQKQKQSLLSLANKAAEFGWIPSSTSEKGVISLAEIKEKLENDTLTIGVIGQMKCGKSTFLNSFVFENDVLPAATTPMTAALSVITYGEKERIVAEFYSPDEWAEQKQQASRSLDDAAGTLDESKIKAAKELVEKSVKLGSSLQSLLGKTQEDSFKNLIEYVGADGKYISITKSVTIYYPKEYLKGVEIVDTPGFNDPIVSREERTKDFLKKADVVLMMLYAGRPFDATDRDIIFKNVRQCGIGKVLVGINKYDIPFCDESNPEDESQIKDYVKKEIKKACADCKDNTLIEILSEVEPIPLSAEMALLSEIPMSAINSSEAFDFAWKRHCSNFGISTQREMRQCSHIDDLINAVKGMVDKEKSKILFAKPLNAIIAAGDKVMADNDNEINKLKSEIELLQMSDSDVDDKEDNLNKAKKRLSTKIGYLGDDLDSEIKNLVRKGNNELVDIVDASCQRMREILHGWSRVRDFSSIQPQLDYEIQMLSTRKLKIATENLADEGKRKIESCVGNFFDDAEDILMRFLPDFDSDDFVKSTRKDIQLEIDGKDLFKYDNSLDDDDDDVFWDFLNGASFGILNLAGNLLCHNEVAAKVENYINSISNDFEAKPYLDNAFKSKDMVISKVKEQFIKNLLEPLQEQIQEIRNKKDNKEKTLQDAETKLNIMEAKKKQLTLQKEEIERIKINCK